MQRCFAERDLTACSLCSTGHTVIPLLQSAGRLRNSLVSVSTLRCDTIRCGPTKDARDEPETHLQENVAPQAPAAIQMSLSMTGRREHV